MTVSRVVNRMDNVRPSTRAKVEQAVAALDYVPNAAARSLAGRRQCRIALLYSNPSAAYLSDFLVGSIEGSRATDAQLVVEAWTEEDDPSSVLGRLHSHKIDAVLLPPPLCDDAELLAALTVAGLPFAQIATGRAEPGALAVTIDDRAAAHAMTAYLIALGHRRIGFIVGAANQTASDLRRDGYLSALADAGIDPDPALLAQGDFSFRSGLDSATKLLALMDRPTAIFASNDDMATAALAAAHRHRLDVPGDLTVVGYDDSAMARSVWPELTTIRQPIAEMARMATERLDRQINGESPPEHLQLAFELIERNSHGRRDVEKGG